MNSAPTSARNGGEVVDSARVLLIDDHPALLLALSETLRRRLSRVEVETCTTCADAMSCILGRDYDAIVADVQLPDGNGLELLAQARVTHPDSPVILITGHDDKDLALRSLRGGAYDLILKPVDPDYFAHTVGLAIERRQLRRELDARERILRRNSEELEKAVMDRTQELRDANRLKDEFLATVSHELRTPLTPILGWARLLKSPRLDKTTFDEAVASIERNARAQSQLIDDLLDVSRIVTGKLRLDVQDLDLKAVLDSAVDTVLPAARAKNVRIRVEVNPTLVTSLAGDPQRLRQVFWNLLTNAVKFSKPGDEVRITCEQADSSLRIRVIDVGSGISGDLLPFVFDRFRQGHGPGSRTGLGLGLAIVRHLVDLHGGSVDATSDGKDRGSTFTVTLPLKATSVDSVPARSSMQRPEVPPVSQCLHGMHVLILEDTSDTQQVLTATLEIAGARVTAVASSAQALEVIDKDPPHVMLCDIGLGEEDEDGYSFIRKVRGRPAERGGAIPAVALTALAKPEDRVQSLRAGFQLHLAKPGPSNLPLILARLVMQSARSRLVHSPAPH
ncbi:MAG: response regulator [Polyangiaceae bacterium]|nr:response regulator [Polyangiaceae bacterium]